MARYKMPGRFSDRHEVKKNLRLSGLHTVCEEAKCPNISECFGSKTATFLIMGERCTRNCRFCAIRSGQPSELDPDEPRKVAEAVRQLGIKHAVITSVTRDDLPDGGAKCFAACVGEIKRIQAGVCTEVLVPDFNGDADSINIVLETSPEVFNHNIETISRLYPTVRPEADFQRSLQLLSMASSGLISSPVVKSGFMVGLGETDQEVVVLLKTLKQSGCQLVTIGQYLRPTLENIPVDRDVTDDQYDFYCEIGRKLGLLVVAGPLVRSSYRAFEAYNTIADTLKSEN